MNRVLKIIIYAVVVFLIYLWISSVAKSCSSPAKKSDIGTTQEGSDDFSFDDEIYDEYFEDETSTNVGSDEIETIDVSDGDSGSPQKSVDDFSYEATQEEVEELSSAPQTTVAKPESNITRTTPSSYDDGKYLVIAGSYLIRDNADKMVDKLKNLGFYDAEIVTFDLSQYYSITAGRYSSYESASEVARKVKNNGIDCYVHTRKE